MAYFDEDGKGSKVTFTRSLVSIRQHSIKFSMVILVVTLVLFSISSSLRPWFCVDVECSNVTSTVDVAKSANETNTDSRVSSNVTDKREIEIVFGVSTVCLRNKTESKLTCRYMASFDIDGAIPLGETKNLLMLVIMLNALALLLIASTYFCNPGFAKTSVMYIVLGCLGFGAVCSMFGMREATVNFVENVRETLHLFVFSSENEYTTCTIIKSEKKLFYKMTIASTGLLLVAITFYLVHWKYPKEQEVPPDQQYQENIDRLHHLMRQKYRPMSHVSSNHGAPV